MVPCWSFRLFRPLRLIPHVENLGKFELGIVGVHSLNFPTTGGTHHLGKFELGIVGVHSLNFPTTGGTHHLGKFELGIVGVHSLNFLTTGGTHHLGGAEITILINVTQFHNTPVNIQKMLIKCFGFHAFPPTIPITLVLEIRQRHGVQLVFVIFEKARLL